MAIIGIFFGSDTGNTENIAKMIQKQLGKDVADVHDIAKSSKSRSESSFFAFDFFVFISLSFLLSQQASMPLPP